MVKKDGLVKILDFGLAKLTSTGSGSGEGSQLPTMMLTQPSFMKRVNSREIDSGVSEYWPSESGRPAFG